MAEKKTPQEEKTKFDTEMYKLGLELIEAYRKGNCSNRSEILEKAIKIFEISKQD